nr:valine--tRNA ligase [Actinomycetota bacterium]
LFGSAVVSPLFEVEVPVRAHELAQPDKGSGIAMVCTFGDTTDVTWWRELDLPVRSILERNGRLRAEPPAAITSERGRAAYAELAGKTVKQAQARIVELLREAGELDGEPRPITHAVKFYEKGDRPLEVVTSRQWYIRNGGRDRELRDVLLRRGKDLDWHPGWMQSRYDSWVEGLNGDWLVSRQRFFGVPFPLWYPVRPDGSIDRDAPIVPPESSLPIDPSSDVPSGFSAEQRGTPGGFVGDPDVMDTWATSSLTPQIACGWEDDPDLFARTFPMDVRPQGPEIIRTWLFSTLLRSHLEHDRLPWSDTSINGWILDPDRKKMSKSKGNVVTPAEVLQRHGSDAVRYWAACARPGTDTALDEGQMKVGRRLAVKLLNASKFALAFPEAGPGPVTEPVDRALLARLASVVEEATSAFDGYDYARALERTEAFFWLFCDDYIELVKSRAYDEGTAADSKGADSARRALRLALSVLLRLFAPVLPFTTEEVWSWWQPGSVHAQSWPEAAQLREAGGAGDPALLMVAGEVLGQIRKAKSSAKVSMRAPVERLEVRAGRERAAYVRQVETDLRGAGVVTDLVVSEVEGDEGVDVTLAPTDHFAG